MRPPPRPLPRLLRPLSSSTTTPLPPSLSLPACHRGCRRAAQLSAPPPPAPAPSMPHPLQSGKPVPRVAPVAPRAQRRRLHHLLLLLLLLLLMLQTALRPAALARRAARSFARQDCATPPVRSPSPSPSALPPPLYYCRHRRRCHRRRRCCSCCCSPAIYVALRGRSASTRRAARAAVQPRWPPQPSTEDGAGIR